MRELDAQNQELLQRLDAGVHAGGGGRGSPHGGEPPQGRAEERDRGDRERGPLAGDHAEIDVKLALARQVGDEAKHYRLIADRLQELGFDARGFDPLAKGYGPLFQYLDGLRTTVERVAAGQFTREAIAVVKNRQFIEFCEAAGDEATARLYREIIEPDERHHHELGRRLLLRYATTPETQAAARRAAARTLELAEELQALALRTAGIHHAPGC